MPIGSTTSTSRGARRPGASPIEAEVAARLQALEAGSADDIRQRIKRGTRAPQPGPELVVNSTTVSPENEQRIRANAEELTHELNEAMVALVIQQPGAADALARLLEPIHTNLRDQATATRARAERLEHDVESGGGGLSQMLAGFRLVPGQLVRLPGRLQLVLDAQRANLAAEILHTASGVAARALAQAAALGNQRSTLGATIARAREIAEAEITELIQRLERGQILDDLPPGAPLHLARAVAAESSEVLRPQALAVVATAMAESSDTAEPVSAEALLERVRLESIPPRALAPQCVEAAVGMIARQLDADPQELWRWTLDEFTRALKRAPGMPIAPGATRQLQAYLFQVLPPGQSPVVAANEEVRVAYFQAPGAPSRLGLVGFVTNFPLADVEPARELADELARAVMTSNPYILPHRARPVPASKLEPPQEPDPGAHGRGPRPEPNGQGPTGGSMDAVPTVGPVAAGTAA